MKWYEASALVAAIFTCFALIHSMLVTDAAKSFAQRALGERFVRAYYRLAYTVISALTTAATIFLIIMVPDRILLVPPLWLKVPFHAMQLLGIVIGALAFRGLSTGEFIGVSQATRALTGKESEGDEEGLKQELVTTGIYSRVRNPLFLAGILIFTFNPHITRSWLTVSALADIYFVIGAFIEERRLLARFGDEYRQYMKRVPRLVPKIF